MLRYVTDSLGPLPGDGLSRVEAAIGSPLPAPYRQFLLQHNGGRPAPTRFRVTWADQPYARRFPYDEVHFLFGLRAESPSDLLENRDLYQGRVPPDTLPIGRDPGGNLILLGVIGPNLGQVFLWVQDGEVDEGEEPDYGNVGLIAVGFDAFLAALDDA